MASIPPTLLAAPAEGDAPPCGAAEQPSSPASRWREAHPSDHARLLQVIETYFELDHIPFDRAAVAEGLHQLLVNPGIGSAWLVEGAEPAAPLAYALATFAFDLEYGGMLAIVTDLYVATAARRQGLALAGLDRIERWARARGARALELQPELANTAARQLYQKFGFVEHSRIPMAKRLLAPTGALPRDHQ